MKKFWFWFPRVLTIAFIAFLALFALDVFDGSYGFWGTALALFMHLIPNFILTGLLLLAWRWEVVGGWIFICLGAAVIFVSLLNGFPNLIFLIMVAIGILFLLSHKYSKNTARP